MDIPTGQALEDLLTGLSVRQLEVMTRAYNALAVDDSDQLVTALMVRNQARHDVAVRIAPELSVVAHQRARRIIAAVESRWTPSASDYLPTDLVYDVLTASTMRLSISGAEFDVLVAPLSVALSSATWLDDPAWWDLFNDTIGLEGVIRSFDVVSELAA